MPFIFVWGKRTWVSKTGVFASYCVVCRDIMPFVQHKVSTYSHFYFIPVSAFSPLHYFGRCATCNSGIELRNGPVSELHSFDGNLDSLIARTNPNVVKIREKRQQLHRAAQQGTLDNQIRMEMAQEPFRALAYQVETLYARSANPPKVTALQVAKIFSPIKVIRSDQPTGSLSPLGTLFVLLAVFGPIIFFVAGAFAAGRGALPFWSLGGALASLLIGIFGAIATQVIYRNFVLQYKILPLLAQSLRPLALTPEEIRRVLRMWESMGFRIGTAIKPDALVHAIESLR